MFDYESNMKKPGALRPDPPPLYTFGANPASPDFETHPELRDVKGYEGVMKAGDILFMPAGMVHQATSPTCLSCPPAAVVSWMSWGWRSLCVRCGTSLPRT